MPIKKRANKTFTEAEDDGKLHIVAKPKTPIPQDAIEEGYFHGIDDPSIVRTIGAIDSDTGFGIADYVAVMRTPYDTKNPQEIRYRNRVRNRATAITAMCIVCTGSRKLVTECIDTNCPLWAFRFGGDPFYGKRK
jgi:hypothetical protein